MKNILFVCTGNSARSIIAESIINNEYNNMYKGFSAGSNPTGKVNEDVKNYLLSKHYDLSNYRSKNFNEFINSQVKMDYVVTVCNNANNEVCPIWPNKDQLIHWDIEDPVARLNSTNDINRKKYIVETTYKIIFKKINELLNEK
ncbi:arsenate reductase ArsC [Candidatus Pelagibacter sp.]|jgi:protein-tyrosine-phosphatase|nr:arsenate reductase ArsC [Candidatus Pelagibacter sp.]|tara:strand:+ start:40 stop:471 length:432 start_codon:yes stop_codon:yes gene_type:complete